ncbi:MAG: D-alanyl-D-alanine carboxypeptidase family protein [Bacillota bacterium]
MVRYGSRHCALTQKIIWATVVVTLIGLSVLCLFPIKQNNVVAEAASGSATIVMEATTNRVLSSSNEMARLPMASTTKIMTSFLAITNCDINEVVTIPKEAVGIEGSSIYLREGEKLTVKELLYGLMMRSGNDAAVALAIHVGGSVEGFADMMNAKVAELGLTNTHFVNPHGLHDDNHYTSAYDLAYISSIAMQNETFKDIVSTKNITIEGDTEDETRYFYNKNQMLSLYNGANGIKTGYTTNSGRCLVSSSLIDGMQIVCVVLNVYDMWNESMALMDTAHATYSMQHIVDSSAVLRDIDVVCSKLTSVGVKCNSDFYYPLKKDGSEVVDIQIECAKSVQAPHNMSEFVGEIKINLENRLLFSDKIYTMVDITELTFKDKVKDFLRIGD